MTTDAKELLRTMIENIAKMDYVKPEDIPNIPLYMDQVTTFMETQLSAMRRHEDDKILTKTMINNYAKNNLVPPPEKKKYSKEHILVLLFIYYFKNILSIGDIQTLLQPITEKYFSKKHPVDLTAIYNEVFSLEKDQIDRVVKDIIRSYSIADSTFSDAPEHEKEFLQQFTFICMLSFDVYVKKHIIEQMIDQMAKKKALQTPDKKADKKADKKSETKK